MQLSITLCVLHVLQHTEVQKLDMMYAMSNKMNYTRIEHTNEKKETIGDEYHNSIQEQGSYIPINSILCRFHGYVCKGEEVQVIINIISFNHCEF